MTYNRPIFDPDYDGTVEADVENSQTLTNLLEVVESGADPSANGEITQNGGTVKVQVNGAVKDLSDIGGYAAEKVRDTVGSLLTAGSNVSISVDDVNDTVTISATDTQLTNTEVESIILPVSAADLDFDPATQSELNSHAGNSAVHHLKTPQYSATTTTTAYTASNYEAVLADASSGAVTVTLPSPTADALVTVKKVDSTNNVTVSQSGSETIDGDSSHTLSTQYEALEFLSDGTNWYII